MVPRRSHGPELLLRALQRAREALLVLLGSGDRSQVPIADRTAHLYDHSDYATGHRPLTVELLLNVIGTLIDAWLWVALWGLIAALGFLAFAVLMCVLRPYGPALVFLWNVAVDIVQIVRGTPARSCRSSR